MSTFTANGDNNFSVGLIRLPLTMTLSSQDNEHKLVTEYLKAVWFSKHEDTEENNNK